MISRLLKKAHLSRHSVAGISSGVALVPRRCGVLKCTPHSSGRRALPRIAGLTGHNLHLGIFEQPAITGCIHAGTVRAMALFLSDVGGRPLSFHDLTLGEAPPPSGFCEGSGDGARLPRGQVIEKTRPGDGNERKAPGPVVYENLDRKVGENP
jgi:hypothetical protein